MILKNIDSGWEGQSIILHCSSQNTTTNTQVYDQTLEYFSEREAENETPVHVINMNVVDNPEDATIGVSY